MTTDINLLLPKDGESLARKRKAKALNIAAIMSAFAIGVMSIVIFLLIKAVNPPSIKAEQDDVLRKLSQFQDRQAKLLTVNNRIESISEILDKRRNLSEATNALLKKIPGNLSIGDLEADSKSISMTGQSVSLLPIGELINNLTDMANKKEIINSLTLTSLIFNEDKRVYQVGIKADLKL